MVHEHDASRLHYDFRLEIGGVLKSWAIPKGPSMNPADKRLAVMVPDHDLDYIDFEGVIPEGSYGAGPVVVWDHGTFQLVDAEPPETQLRAGKLGFILRGRRLNGGFALAQLATGKRGNEWLLIKKKDEWADPSWMLKTELTPRRLKALSVRTPSCDVS